MLSSARVLALAGAVLIAGCTGGPTTSSTPSPSSPSTGPAPNPSTSPSAGRSASLAPPSPVVSPPASATPVASAANGLVGSVVKTLADDGLRVRSEPGVTDGSRMLEPLVPLGSRLFVLDGPVLRSGYSWYAVVPLGMPDLPSGWIAAADRDGEPWIAVASFDCPPLPTDIRSLAALGSGVGLACFPGVPITVEARLLSCNCDIDGAWYTPFWFFLASGSPNLLVEPDVLTPSTDTIPGGFVLNLDPEAEQPDPLPIGDVVEVTGTFDHPAAAGCTATEMDGQPVATLACRAEFAVTRMLVFGP
jgi:hypothetical protein